MTALSSMQYTIGTALERARERGSVVELLVEGSWITGLVVASDGLGVILEQDGLEHFIVRLDRISAVRVGAEAPRLRPVADAYAPAEDRTHDGAVPMPGPRTAGV